MWANCCPLHLLFVTLRLYVKLQIFMSENKKVQQDLIVADVKRLNDRYVLLRLTADEALPTMHPGQFVQVRVDGSPVTFLRRPISICYYSGQTNELWLLVACVGEGTRRLAQLQQGQRLNCLLPLGHGFTLPSPSAVVGEPRLLLVGGGVGVAPLHFLGAEQRQLGANVTFLLGARSKTDLLLLDQFSLYGRVLVTTEDGSMGESGFVTQHSVLQKEHFDFVQCCGPTPMMKAVARYARQSGTPCEVSLENLMACGLGACLCCVEKVAGGPDGFDNVCVCKEGPVFNINRLLWQD